MLVWHLHQFDALTARQLYLILQLRQDVFVVEQSCAYPDLDGKDLSAWHLSAWQDQQPLAYARLLPPELPVANQPPELGAAGCSSIGRVCTALAVRKTGLGRELMLRAQADVVSRWPDRPCQIGAQSYLRKFYESLGFVVNGSEYLEDNIPHFPMRWSLQP